MPKHIGYPRKLLGHAGPHSSIKYTPETEIACKRFYRANVSCKCTYSALSGHPVFSALQTLYPSVSPRRDWPSEAELLWRMDVAFWGPQYLIRGSLSSDKHYFQSCWLTKLWFPGPLPPRVVARSLLVQQGEEKIFGLRGVGNSLPCIADRSAWFWVEVFCTCFAQEWALLKVPGKWSIADVQTPWAGSQLPRSCVSIYSAESEVLLNQNRNNFYSLWMRKSGHIVLLELQAICNRLSPSTCFAQQVFCNYLIIKIIGIFTLLVLCRSWRLPSNFYTSWEFKPDVLADFQVGRLDRRSKSCRHFSQPVALSSSSRGGALRNSCIALLGQRRNTTGQEEFFQRKTAYDLVTLTRSLGSCRDERGHMNQNYRYALLVWCTIKAHDNLHMIIKSFQHMHKSTLKLLWFYSPSKKTLSKYSKTNKGDEH